MSREIKFRAWHETDKCWYNPRFIEMNLLGQAMLRGAVGLFEIIPASAIEQYTGLKDKNGKEIYEGDILRVCHNRYDKPNKKGDRQLVEETFNCIVVRDTYKFGFKHQFAERASHIYYWDDFETHRFHDVTKIEIVGNIHETPELLEDK